MHVLKLAMYNSQCIWRALIFSDVNISFEFETSKFFHHEN